MLEPSLYVLTQTGIKSRVPSQMIGFNPKSKWFYRNSTTLSFSFAISPIFIPAGNYMLAMRMSGGDQTAYSINNVSMSILASTSPPLTPSLSFARMSDNGAALYLVFDSNTNYGGQSNVASWSCGSMWRFAGYEDSRCTWLNRTTLFVELPTTSTMIPGSNITLLPDVIRAECVSAKTSFVNCDGYAATKSQTVLILFPLNGITPSIVLSSASQYSACSSVTLDPTGSTGNGGRTWSSVVWTAVLVDGTIARDLTDFLNAQYGGKTNAIAIIPSTVDSTGASFNPYLAIGKTYFVTLTAKNYLGKTSSASVSFLFGADSNAPLVMIGGSSSITTKAATELELYASAEVAKCSKSTTSLKYSWSVLVDKKLAPISSQSKNPLRFYLPPYRLAAGSIYTIVFNASTFRSDGLGIVFSTASVSVTVSSGLVVAKLSGGKTRYIREDTILDASLSYDQDYNMTANLRYFWSCRHGSVERYGQSCDDIAFPTLGSQNFTTTLVKRNESILTIRYAYLAAYDSSNIYNFEVLVFDSQNTQRFDVTSTTIRIVVITPEAPAYAVTALTSSVDLLNEDSPSVITGSVVANTPIFTLWEIFVSGTRQLVSTISPVERNFTYGQVVNSISFPIVLPGYTFVGGTTVTFRLSTYRPKSSSDMSGMPLSSQRMLQVMEPLDFEYDLISYCDIDIKVNAPPRGGKTTVSPMTGIGLNTTFSAITSNWIEEATDLPLTYDFRYKVTSFLFFRSRNSQSQASTKLPVGPETMQYQIMITARAYDIHIASAYANEYVTVRPAPASSNVVIIYNTVLQELLTSANTVGDIDATISAINIVSSAMNTVNCTGFDVVHCAKVNRYPCSVTTRTCSSCLPGFTGLVGDSNSMCFPKSKPPKQIGESCSHHFECIYGECSESAKICVAPVKTCPAGGNRGEQCSGHGRCEHSASGKPITSTKCTILQSYCTVACVCQEGYGSKDCSLDLTVVQDREVARISMCSHLKQATSSLDDSPTLIASLSASMLSAYDEYEVTSSGGVTTCAESLLNILSATASGNYLDMTSTETVENLVGSIGKFLKPGNSSFVGDMTSMLVKSAMSSMTEGQNPVDIVTPNLKLSFVEI
jgi:hypothetical protein